MSLTQDNPENHEETHSPQKVGTPSEGAIQASVGQEADRARVMSEDVDSSGDPGPRGEDPQVRPRPSGRSPGAGWPMDSFREEQGAHLLLSRRWCIPNNKEERGGEAQQAGLLSPLCYLEAVPPEAKL